ncbi:MAG: 23S rRNA (guanosine(2251)-2'-O)-methyltransferase RlmB [Bacilli bacterium]|nr:23S rRNA (guanosine(2251)-2'-O)-methyltransferase RlmB [Bacilli bacterium]
MRVYGKNVAKEVIEKEKIKKAYISKNFNDKEIMEKLKENKVQIKFIEKNILDKMEKGNHQGIILEIEDYDYSTLDEIEKEEVIIMLDHLEDPHNFGAIIRTVEAAGFKSIIIPKDRSVEVNQTVMKTSVGTIENVKIAKVSNLVNTIKELKERGYWVIGTDMNGEYYKNIDYTGKIVIIIGNEGKGMSRLVKENCDFIASIPMRGEVNSLNASVAAALIIYEAVRKIV